MVSKRLYQETLAKDSELPTKPLSIVQMICLEVLVGHASQKLSTPGSAELVIIRCHMVADTGLDRSLHHLICYNGQSMVCGPIERDGAKRLENANRRNRDIVVSLYTFHIVPCAVATVVALLLFSRDL